jgi:pilus assembly protein CpaB
MNNRLLGVIVFALLVALGTSYGVYRLLSGKLATNTVQTTRVLVASRDIPVGSVIQEADMRETDWGGVVPPNALLKKEDIVERGVIQPISAGELFVESRLSPKGTGGGLAIRIPEGMRAIAIRVNDVVALAGFATPGQRVDLIIMGNPPGAGQQTMGTQARTILQNIEVLSAGQQIQNDPQGKPMVVPVINLLVTPEQAEILSLAGNQTTIQLALRNPMDKEEAKTPGTALGQLFSGRVGAPLPGAAPPKQGGPRAVRTASPSPKTTIPPAPPQIIRSNITMEIIHGSKKEAVKVGEEERVKEGTAK